MGNEGRFLCRTAPLPASACTSRHEKRRRFSACTASLDFWTLHGVLDSMLHALRRVLAPVERFTACRIPRSTACTTPRTAECFIPCFTATWFQRGPSDSRHAPDSCSLSQRRRRSRQASDSASASILSPADLTASRPRFASRSVFILCGARRKAVRRLLQIPLQAVSSASSGGQKRLRTAFRAFGRDAQIHADL